MAKMSKKARVLKELEPWIAARKKFRLTDAQVQMARELGFNPQKLGSKANHDQEPWKLPLPQWIEELYLKRFNRARPERVLSLEQRAAEIARKAEAKTAAKLKRLRREAGEAPPTQEPAGPAPAVETGQGGDPPF